MYIRIDYEISLCSAIRLAGSRSAENGRNLRQIQVATTSNRLYVIYYEVITTMSRLLSETLVGVHHKKHKSHKTDFVISSLGIPKLIPMATR